MTDPVWSVLAEVVLKHTPCLPASHARVKEALGWVVVVGVCGCQLLAAVVVELQRALQAAAVQGESARRVRLGREPAAGLQLAGYLTFPLMCVNGPALLVRLLQKHDLVQTAAAASVGSGKPLTWSGSFLSVL